MTAEHSDFDSATSPEDRARMWQHVRAWIDDDPDEHTAAELTALLRRAEAGDADAERELADRFSGFLQFGTAGLRGPLGGGPARMNRAVVIRAAAGLSNYLHERINAPVVVIGFDARYGSAQFARDTADVVAAGGGQAYLFDGHCPTPVLAFAVRHLGADAGVMVTASHNPPGDNGYKVYLGGRLTEDAARGVQIVPPADEQIAAHIAAVPSVQAVPRSWDQAGVTGGTVSPVGSDLGAAYIDSVLELAREHGTAGRTEPAADERPLRVVVTAMHGVGGDIARRVLQQAGFDVTMVAEQADPDPDFPTVAFPNPEEAGALDRAIATASAVGADLIIANDPDADRVSIAVPTPQGGWHQLTGDEAGALLGAFLATRMSTPSSAQATTAPGVVFASSIVSSRLLATIAADHGITHHTTLTGFKWISRTPDLGYGYEEALGYCVDPASVRDKDGISAGLMFALIAAHARAHGRTVLDRLDDLARRYGLYATAPLSVRVEDLAQIPAAMQRLRTAGPSTLAGAPVTTCIDLAGGGELPATDGLIYLTDAQDRIVVRPSGTEPKIKCYLEVVRAVDGENLAEVRAEAHARLEQLSTDIAAAAGL